MPGQTPNNQNANQHEQANQREAETNPAASLSPGQAQNEKPRASEYTERDADANETTDPLSPVTVNPVSVTKDSWDKASIVATVLIAVVTFILAGIAYIQAKVARASVIATLRPKLVIRGIELVEGNLIEADGVKRVEDDLQWQIKYVVANTGGTPAHVTESNLTVAPIDRIEGKLPTFPPYSKKRDSLGCFTVEPGEYKEELLKLDAMPDTERLRMLRAMRRGGSDTTGKVYCLGFIQYRDDVGTKRRTAFCLHYDVQTDRFDRVDDPNYEYAD
jgi:hypothetical protein